MTWQDMTLNFMTLGGLAISVGRVVDDAIVVLENVYRHIQAGRERWRAALDATTEVGPAIFASTLTTIVGSYLSGSSRDWSGPSSCPSPLPWCSPWRRRWWWR